MTYVNRILANGRKELSEFMEDKRQQLDTYKVTLTETLDVLQRLDEDILDNISDKDELHAEIQTKSDIRGEMLGFITQRPS